MPPTSASALQAVNDFSSTRATPDSAITAGDNKYGVSGLGSQLDALRTITGNLQTSIKNVDPSVTGRTQGSLVTEAQRGAIVNNERAPLVDQYNTAQTNANDVGSQYNEATGLASNYANSLLTGDENKYNELFGQYTTLAGQEADAAKQAEVKREFDAQLADSQAARSAAAGASSGISLGGGSNLSNKETVAAPATAQDHLTADIQRLITPDYATRFGTGYTEREITRLQQAYPEIPAATIAQQVYAYRKPYETPAAGATPSNSASQALGAWAGV